MKSPCKECEDRILGCHADCERYKEFQKDREQIRKNRKAQHDYDSLNFMNKR